MSTTITKPTADKTAIREALGVLLEPGAVAEVRAFKPRNNTISGYYTDHDKLADDAARVTAPGFVTCKVRRNGQKIVLHVINRDYDAERLTMREAKDVRLAMPAALAQGHHGLDRL